MALTNQEMQTIVDMVLQALRTNSLTISQMIEVQDYSSSDYIELNSGRRISLSVLAQRLKEDVSQEFYSALNKKQNKLHEGENINLDEISNVISAIVNIKDLYIGENGNWFINGVDTGKPSRGEAGVSLGDVILSHELSVEEGSENRVLSQKIVSEKIFELEQNGLGGSAENVRFNTDLTITADIGVQTVGTSGSKTLATKGKSVKQVFDMICASERNPSITQPYVNITSSSMGSKEVGTLVTPVYNATFNKGTYQYGPDTDVSVTSWEISDTNGGSSTEATGSFDEFQVTDDTNYSITAKAYHTEGAIPVTNLGNPYEEGKIQAAIEVPKSKTVGTITGHRKYFYGTTNDNPEIDSDYIRSLNKSTGAYSSRKFTITVPVGTKRICVACIDSETGVTSMYNKTVNATLPIVKRTGVMVEGANGYSPVAYNVWTFEPAEAYSTTADIEITLG